MLASRRPPQPSKAVVQFATGLPLLRRWHSLPLFLSLLFRADGLHSMAGLRCRSGFAFLFLLLPPAGWQCLCFFQTV